MKRLILFRHGKSDWNARFPDDHSRPLTERGSKAARQMGKLLAVSSQVPRLIISSTAVRARSTVELAMEAGQWTAELQFSDVLYASSPARVLAFLHQLPDAEEEVMLVGHEPTWSGLVYGFSGARVRVPTAAMVAMQFPGEHWQDLHFDSGELIWLLQPKFFKTLFAQEPSVY
ncbi:SixA phosphatase family protein [Thiolapillus sp.]